MAIAGGELKHRANHKYTFDHVAYLGDERQLTTTNSDSERPYAYSLRR
jgi:hypothetical protein